MAASFMHFTISKGNHSKSSFLNVELDKTVGDVILDLIDNDNTAIESVGASKNGSSEVSQTPTDTPCGVLHDFGFRHILVKVVDQTTTKKTETEDTTSVFDILMSTQKRYTSLPKKKLPTNGKTKLFNALIDVLGANSVGFTSIQVDSTGSTICNTLCNALWYLDAHIDKFRSRGIIYPKMLRDLTGFNDWKKQKHKEPMVKTEDLESHISSLGNILMMPYFLNSQVSYFKSEVECLMSCASKYRDFLVKQRTRTAKNHQSPTPVRSLSDAWSLREVVSQGPVHPAYSEVYNTLLKLENYTPVCLYPFQPHDRLERRNWVENFSLPCPVKIYTHYHGNYLGNFFFVWRIPDTVLERSQMEDVNVLAEIREDLPTFSTRAMRKEFMQRYAQVTGVKPAILRDMYKFLTQDTSAAESSHQAEVDERVSTFILNSDDTDLLYDLRRNNGRPTNKDFDPFWDELGKLLEEASVVHERRQGPHMYMPLAISLDDLRQQIVHRLPPQSPTPSVSWIRMNFWPMNPYARTALHYTGRFKVKNAIQQRLLRSKHPDTGYAYHQFMMMKEMAVKLKEHSTMVCLDDKSVVPIGEPEQYVSTGVRSHNKSLVPAGVQMVALDHDFHVHGAIPSVLFDVNIPENAGDSFYDGTIHVTVKDKIFSPSTATRHATETLSILRGNKDACSDRSTLDTPVLFVFTDGGPDHRSTYWSVQLSYILLFMALDIDLLVTARTAPSNSYANPAERCMSLLNMALQNVALARREMDEAWEFQVKSLSSMKSLRDCAKRKPALKDALESSLEPVIALLKQRFSHLKFHEEEVVVHDAASELEIEDTTSLLAMFGNEDNPCTIEKLQKKSGLKGFPLLDDFVTHHCRFRQYSFQVKKCNRNTCFYCIYMHPKRIPDDDVVNWLPDCVPDSDGYKNFSEVYGSETDDGARPSLKSKDTATENDKELKGTLVAAKARAFILCSECGKRRVVFSAKKMTSRELAEVRRLDDELVFTCGSISSLTNCAVVREGITCSSPIETAYYSSVLCKFPPICIYCGDIEDLADGPEIENLTRNYGIVRPICTNCVALGKQPYVRNALKVGKRKR